MGCISSSPAAESQPLQAIHAANEFRQRLVWTRRENFFEEYEVLREIGSGSMGTVSVVQRKQHRNSTGAPRQFAMKTIIVNRVTTKMINELENEIQILRTLDHPNIIQLHEVFYNNRNIYLVMELCYGGHVGTRSLNEAQVAVIACQTLRALAYLHEKQICHRDVKLENILFMSSDNIDPVKLIDFGLSQTYSRGPHLRSACGTIYTMAPEVLAGTDYTQQADMWSFGVVLYVLLCDQVPFLRRPADLANDYERQRLLNARVSYGSSWIRNSSESKGLVDRLLRKRPQDRLTARAALSFALEKWIPAIESRPSASSPEKTHILSPPKSLDPSIIRSWRSFSTYGNFKRAAFMVLAFSMDKSQLLDLTEVFTSLDVEKNGVLSFQELSEGLQEAGVPDDERQSLFAALDQDRSGHLHYMEFLAATLEARGFIEEERFAEAFDRMDVDKSGYISKENLREVVGSTFDEATLDRMMSEANLEHAGKIHYEEFRSIMQREVNDNFNVSAIIERAAQGGLDTRDAVLVLPAPVTPRTIIPVKSFRDVRFHEPDLVCKYDSNTL